MACGILVPQPGIKPVPPSVEPRSLNHWIAREVPKVIVDMLELISCILFFVFFVSSVSCSLVSLFCTFLWLLEHVLGFHLGWNPELLSNFFFVL